jgi:hypothetical protein
MHLEGPTTMTHTRLHSGMSPLAAAAYTGAVAPAQVVDKRPAISLPLAREIAVAAAGIESSRGRPSGALVGRAWR